MRILYENGVMNYGNVRKIQGVMKRALKGEKLTIGFLGGSITQGCLSSVPETCYAYLVYKWWVNNFPKATFEYVNAGIGGTTSHFGVARVQDDLFAYKPDFSVMEFAVNDESNAHFMETYEGLVRKFALSDVATMLLMNVRYDNMDSAEDKHLIVAKYYDFPTVSMKHSLYPLVANGTIPNRTITQDDLHPNDEGHAYLAGQITFLLEEIYRDLKDGKEEKRDYVLPKPLTCNTYENAVRLQSTNFEPVCEGFVKDETPMKHITECFRNGYTAWKKGDKISFSTECTGVAIQYRKSVNKPTPIAKVTFEDLKESVVLDGNFDEDWGDCLYITTAAEHLERKMRTITVELVETHDDDVVPFYLVSVIVTK